MGIVAPGNKQIGSFTFDLLHQSNKSVKVVGGTSFALTKSSGAIAPLPPYNVNIGSCTIDLLGAVARQTIKIEGALALALVKYLPPTRIYLHSGTGFALVKNKTDSALAPVKNINIGSTSFSILNSGKDTVYLKAVTGLALVQSFEERKKNVYHGINYGLKKTFL